MIAEVAMKQEISRNWATHMTQSLRWTEGLKKLDNARDVQQLLSELKFKIGMSIPDTAFALNKMARMTHQATLEVYRAGKRMLACLISTQSLSLYYRTKANRHLPVWVDNFYMDIRESKCRSIGWYLVTYGGNVIHWLSKKIRWVDESSAGAEYLALALK